MTFVYFYNTACVFMHLTTMTRNRILLCLCHTYKHIYHLLLLPFLIPVVCFFFSSLKTLTQVLFAWVTLIFSNISET